MADLDWLGQEGGKLAMAFAAGCVATFGFMSAVGGFMWKMIGGHRKDRITELETALAEERANCHEQLTALNARIQHLEALFTMHTGIQIGMGAVQMKPVIPAVRQDRADIAE
jgi:hypothetical protein